MNYQNKNPRETIKNIINRNSEIAQARAKYPGMEIGQAYAKWKKDQGETATMLNTEEREKTNNEIRDTLQKLRERPCTKPGCDGTQILEGVCAGCIEGQAGYKSKWTCNKCLHRDLSREDMNTWLNKLSATQK